MSWHGHDAYVQIGKETVYGNRAGVLNEWIGIVQSFSPEESNNLDKQYGLGSRNYIQSKVGSKTFGGSIEFLVQNFKMFEYALGAVEYGEDSEEDGRYVHKVTEANDLPSFTIQAGLIGASSLVKDYLGCKVDSLTLSAEKEAPLTCEVEFIAQDMVDGTNGTPPAEDTSSYFSFYEGAITIDGVKQDLVEQFELEISNGLEALFAIGSDKIVRLQEGQREYSLSLDFIFEDLSQFVLWKNGVSFDAELKFVAPDGRELQILCHDCKYDSSELELGAEDYVLHSLEAAPRSVSIQVLNHSPTSL